MYDDFERRYRQGGARAREEHLARLSHAPAPADTLAPTTTLDTRLEGLPGRPPAVLASHRLARADARHLGKASLPVRTPPEAA
jgi:hypothetical protein